MNLSHTLSSSFAAITFMILGCISIFKIGTIDMSTVFELMLRTVPATIVMGVLGKLMGSILDRPKNLADSDYQTAVLKGLKKIDKNMTLSDLNEKLAPIEETPNEIQIQTPLEGENNEPTA